MLFARARARARVLALALAPALARAPDPVWRLAKELADGARTVEGPGWAYLKDIMRRSLIQRTAL
eukprot:15299664-Alexandrium_andersonii.AAC.1